MTEVAVITGGSRGIGAATATLLASRGWAVCVGYLSAVDAASRVVSACEEAGAIALAVPVDVSSADDVAELFAAADRLGPLGVAAGPTNKSRSCTSPTR